MKISGDTNFSGWKARGLVDIANHFTIINTRSAMTQPYHHYTCILHAVQKSNFFPGLLFYVYIESSKPEKPLRPHTKGPTPHQVKSPLPIPRPQPPNYHKSARMRKSVKRNPGKKSAKNVF